MSQWPIPEGLLFLLLSKISKTILPIKDCVDYLPSNKENGNSDTKSAHNKWEEWETIEIPCKVL